MSYARLSYCDVYVYDDIGFGLRCMMCKLQMAKGLMNIEFGSDARAMVAHLKEHEAAGHDVAMARTDIEDEIAAGMWDGEKRAAHEAALKAEWDRP